MSSKNNPFKKRAFARFFYCIAVQYPAPCLPHFPCLCFLADTPSPFLHTRCQIPLSLYILPRSPRSAQKPLPVFLLQRGCVFSVVPRQVCTLLSPAPFSFACVFHAMPNMPLFPSFIPADSKFLTKKTPPYRGVFFCLFFGQPFRARHFHQVINQHCRQHIDDKRKRRIGQHAHPRHIANQRLLNGECR